MLTMLHRSRTLTVLPGAMIMTIWVGVTLQNHREALKSYAAKSQSSASSYMVKSQSGASNLGCKIKKRRASK